MGLGLFIIGTWSLVLFATSLLIAFNANHFYFFTLPFIVASVLIVILTLIAGLSDRFLTALYWIVVILHGLLFLPFFYALNRWPGGDDGPGLAWLLFIGCGSFVAFVLAFVFALKGAAAKDLPQ